MHAAPALLDYVQAIVEHTRRSPEFTTGLSPRAALALLHAARAWALLEGRDKVLPEDVQAVLPGVAGHRLRAGARRRAQTLLRGHRRADRGRADSLRRAEPRARAGAMFATDPEPLAALQLCVLRPARARAGHRFSCAQNRVYILPTRPGLAFALALVRDADRLDQLQPLARLHPHVPAREHGRWSRSCTPSATWCICTSRPAASNRYSPASTAWFELIVENRSGYDRCAIALWPSGKATLCDVASARGTDGERPGRGRAARLAAAPRITVDTRFPVGLLRAWSYIQPDMRCLVYPQARRRPAAAAASRPAAAGRSASPAAAATISPDCARTRSSDSPRHIDWKAAARGRGPADQGVQRPRRRRTVARLERAAGRSRTSSPGCRA